MVRNKEIFINTCDIKVTSVLPVGHQCLLGHPQYASGCRFHCLHMKQLLPGAVPVVLPGDDALVDDSIDKLHL